MIFEMLIWFSFFGPYEFRESGMGNFQAPSIRSGGTGFRQVDYSTNGLKNTGTVGVLPLKSGYNYSV